MNDIDELLKKYEPGKPENKLDVKEQLNEMKEKRQKMIENQIKEQQAIQNYNEIIQKHTKENINVNNKMDELIFVVNNLTLENNQLKIKNEYLEKKIKKLIEDTIRMKTS
jgi:poly-D-alanine transfer protein DltD